MKPSQRLPVVLLVLLVSMAASCLLIGCAGYFGEKGVIVKVGASANKAADTMRAEPSGDGDVDFDWGGVWDALGKVAAGAVTVGAGYLGVKTVADRRVVAREALPFLTNDGRKGADEDAVVETVHAVPDLAKRIEDLEAATGAVSSAEGGEAKNDVPTATLPSAGIGFRQPAA